MTPLDTLTAEQSTPYGEKPRFIFRCSMPAFEFDRTAWDYLAEEGFTFWRTNGNTRTSSRRGKFAPVLYYTVRGLAAEMTVVHEGETAKIEFAIQIEGQDFTQNSQLEVAFVLWTLRQIVDDPANKDSEEVRQLWSDFRKHSTKAMFRSGLTLFMSGRTLDDTWRARAAELISGWEPLPPHMAMKVN